jgi:transposase
MKARYRPYNPEEGYFTLIDPVDIRNHNPLLKAINSFVEEHISVEPFSQGIKNEAEGAPAVHPRMMLKVIFYSYAKGVYSSREMEDRMRWDPNYIYLSANQRVDHSTICNFILKYGEQVKAVFSRLVYVMAKMGYITMDFVAVDGTKIRANAGRRFTGDVAEFRQQRDRIERKIEKILHHTVDEAPEGKARQEKKLDTLEREKAKIEAFLTEVEQEEKPPKGKTSLTDRDARMVKDKDGKYMGYNCQLVVDDESHAIVGAEVFNEASDRGLLQPMIEEVRDKTNDLRGTEISADAGYFSSDNIQYCHDQGLDVYLPEGTGEGGVRQWQGDLIQGRDCRLEIDGDIKRLTCPGGQVMETMVAKEDRGSYFYRFRPDARKCRDCASRARCYRNKSTFRDFRVKKEYFETLSLRACMTEKLSGVHGKKRMRGRSCLIEHVFGEIKEIFRFRRLAYRGLEKVRLVWQLVCIGYNLRKMTRLAYG